MHTPDLSDSSLAQAARAIHAPHTLDETLGAIVETARNSLPGIDHVGISIVHRNRKIETMAGTGPLVWELDNLQYELSEGPCVYAIEPGDPIVVIVEHARQEQRWPRYIPRAVATGLRSQLAVQLYTDDKRLGGLNMYSTSRDDLAPETVHTAELFATHAALALGEAIETENLNIALHTRRAIGQAVGILMERYRISEERAFAFLARASSTSNLNCAW